ncbi:MAG: FecR family protein [Niastella sp.]|nr:FecR family protein [Niastella sp.]
MQKNTIPWAVLLVKYWQGTLTADEQAELDRQRSLSPAREAEFQQISDPAWSLARLQEIHAATEDAEAGWQDVEQRAASLQRQARLRTMKRCAYAAAAILAGVIIYFAYDRTRQRPVISGKKPGTPSSSPTAAEEKIFPPPNDAKLVLYDGSEYILGDKQHGIIKETKHLQIRKEGLAIYVKQIGAGGDAGSQQNKLILSPGSTCILYLPDNSSVYLNAASTIVFPSAFTGSTRQVDIEGEAFIEIDSQRHTPFVVHLNNKYDVTATGTRFLVRSYSQEAQTVVQLASGKVHINKIIQNTRQPSPIQNIKPLQQFIADGQHENIVACDSPYADKKAWQQSNFNLAKDLRSVMEDIGNWYNMKVSISPDIKNDRLSGTFSRRRSLSLTLNHLRSITSLQYRVSGNEIIVTN